MADPSDDLKTSDELQTSDDLKTVKLNIDEIRKIAEEAVEEVKAAEATRLIPTVEAAEVTRLIPTVSEGEPVHDGRFGERFDDEIDVKSVLWVSAGLAFVTLGFFVGSWYLYRWFIDLEKAATPAPTPVMAEETGRRLPTGPRLQSSPEEELAEMRREADERMHGYGWVDEAAGIVYVPIDKAMDLVVQTGLAPAGDAPPSEEADSP